MPSQNQTSTTGRDTPLVGERAFFSNQYPIICRSDDNSQSRQWLTGGKPPV